MQGTDGQEEQLTRWSAERRPDPLVATCYPMPCSTKTRPLNARYVATMNATDACDWALG